jgi:hypothetical protein
MLVAFRCFGLGADARRLEQNLNRQGLSGGRDDKPEAGLQPVLNFFGNPVEILSRWYRATIAIAADYRRAIARGEFARGGRGLL